MAKKPRAQKGTSAPPKTTGLRIAPNRDKRSERDTAASAQNELQMIGQQITETQELRKSVLDLGITTKSALLKAESAKDKKAAGGAKAVLDAVRHLDKEVGILRVNIEALLKDLEVDAMHLADGTLRPGSFNLETAKAALADFKVHFTELQTLHNQQPLAKQGRGGKAKPKEAESKATHGEVPDEQELATTPNVAMTTRGKKLKNAPHGREVLDEQESATTPNVAMATRAKKSKNAPKDGEKQIRGNADDKPHVGLTTKKARIFDNEADDPMGSDLTSVDGSDGSGIDDSDDEASKNVTPLPNNDVENQDVPAQDPVSNETDEMAGGTLVEGQVLKEPAVARVAPGPTKGHKHKPTPRRSLVEPTTDDIAITNGAVDNMADGVAGGSADDVAGDTVMDMAGDIIDNAAGDTVGGTVGESADGAVSVADEVLDERADNSIDDMASEQDQECDDTKEEDSDLEADDKSVMSDSARMDTDGSGEDSPDAPNDDMRLAAAMDVDDLHKHIITQKALVKKEKEEEVGKAPKQSAPKSTKALKEEANTPKRESLRTKWDAMSEDEQAEKQAAAKKFVRAYLHNPARNPIPVNIRAMIREIAEFCTPACQITRQLALHILENKYHNLFCIYHQTIDKAGLIHDRSGRGAFRVTGTPFSRLANEKPTKLHPTQAPLERRAGYLHCGCPENEALLDFYLWKMAEATSPTTNATEGWLDHRKMDPRTCTLIANFFLDWTYMEVDDIYIGYPIDNSFDARMARWDAKIARLQEAKDEETRVEDMRIRREEERRRREEEEAVAHRKEKGIKRRLAI